jgi:hypothetical protein
MVNDEQQVINLSKDILYLIGSVLGIIGFIRTLKKEDYCSLSYKTDFGNEVEPYLICLKGDMYNLSVSNSERAVFVKKYKATVIPAYESRKSVSGSDIDRAAFFPILKEQEFIVIDNNDLKMKKMYFHYEDKFSNKYKQTFSFDERDIGNNDRIKRINHSHYILSKRKFRFLYIWFPITSKRY